MASVEWQVVRTDVPPGQLTTPKPTATAGASNVECRRWRYDGYDTRHSVDSGITARGTRRASPAGSQGHPSGESTTMSTSGSTSPTRVSFIQAAPEQMLVSDAPQGEGWWQATDAKWYAPEVYPSDTPRGEGWWQAPSGKWFAPMFHPNYQTRTVTPSVAQMPNGGVGAGTVTGAGRPLPSMTMMTSGSVHPLRRLHPRQTLGYRNSRLRQRGWCRQSKQFPRMEDHWAVSGSA